MNICFWTGIIFCFKNPYDPYAKQKIKKSPKSFNSDIIFF